MGRTRKRPWLAAALSLLYPGVGHLYLRQWLRALLWIVLVIGASFVLIPTNIIPETTSLSAILEASQSVPVTATVVILLLRLLSMGDAYVLARRLNASQSPRQRATVSIGNASEDRTANFDLPEELQTAGRPDGDQIDGLDGAPTSGAGQTVAPSRCPSCGRDIDDPELDFCPWCAEPFDDE